MRGSAGRAARAVAAISVGLLAAALSSCAAASDTATGDVAGGCHPSYDPCVPFASDVDCAGGSGNGPAYTGQVRVIGPDDYGLDNDGDGIGCEASG
jgi:hypothetical protein